jgi:hypothetical protein
MHLHFSLQVAAVADNVDTMPILLQFINEQLFDIDAPQTDTSIRSGMKLTEWIS